ncbi:MAG: ABC transporter ATP-binding protein, partial [Zavarzinia sp.]|nr:ABC transporter ATP-binding protein [Zavarzinia sp.]
LELPYAGRVRLDGIDVAEEPRKARRLLGFLDEFFGLYDDLSVMQCLRYWAAAHGVDGDGADVARATAARLGLDDRLGERAGSLSRGLRQRLAIAQAIIHKPRILLMDEPASGLDPEARASLAELILGLRAEGMTIVVSSHILSELEDYSSHMLIVDRGRIVDHAPIGGAHVPAAAGRQVRLRVVLAEAADALDDVLSSPPIGLAVGDVMVAADRRQARFEFAGSPSQQAKLLEYLVNEGLPVIAFAEDHSSLQDRYIEKLKAARP